jgi:hypothetical protein
LALIIEISYTSIGKYQNLDITRSVGYMGFKSPVMDEVNILSLNDYGWSI